jgi:predicted dehydrogenase
MAFRVVVAGLGSRGRDWVREVRADPAYELVAGVDNHPAALRAAPLPPEQRFADLDDALGRTSPDVVIVATPGDDHVAPCEAAIARGLAVLVEKPFTLRLADAARLVALAERRGVPLLVAQNYRYTRSHRTLRRVIRSGALGRVGQFTSQYYRVPHAMAPSLARLPHSILWGAAVHYLDALRYVLDDRVVGVAAQSFTTPWGTLPPGASLQTLLTFAGGARGIHSATYESRGHEYFERGQEFYQRFVGERATLHVFHRWLFLCEGRRPPRFVRRGPRPITEERVLLGQLARAIQHGEEAETSGRDNLQTIALTEACVRAAAEGRWVDPQELLREYA